MKCKRIVIFLMFSLISCDLLAPYFVMPEFLSVKSKSSSQVPASSHKPQQLSTQKSAVVASQVTTNNRKVKTTDANKNFVENKASESKVKENGVEIVGSPHAPKRSYFMFKKQLSEGAKPQGQIPREVSNSFWNSFKDYFKKSESDPSVSKEGRFDSALDRAAAMTSKTYESVKGAPGAAARQIRALARLLKRLTSKQKEQVVQEVQNAPENGGALRLLEQKIVELNAKNRVLEKQLKERLGLQLAGPQLIKSQAQIIDVVKPKVSEDLTSQSKFNPERVRLNEALQGLEKKLAELQMSENPGLVQGEIKMTQGKINAAYKNIVDVMTLTELQSQLSVEFVRKNELQPRVERFNALTVESAQLAKNIIAIGKEIKQAKISGDKPFVDQLATTLNRYNARQKEIRNEVAVLEKDRDSLVIIDKKIAQVQERLGVQSEELASNGLLSQIGKGAKLNTVTVDNNQKSLEPESLKSNNNPIAQEAINKLTKDVLPPAALAKLQLSKIGLFEAQGKKILSDSLVSKEIKNVVEKNMELLQGRRTELQAAPAEQFNALNSKRFEGRGVSRAPMLKGTALQEQVAQKEAVSYVFKNDAEKKVARDQFEQAAKNAIQKEVAANVASRQAKIKSIAAAKFEALSPVLELQIKSKLKDSLKNKADHANFDVLVRKRLQEKKDAMVANALKNQKDSIDIIEREGQKSVEKAGRDALVEFDKNVATAKNAMPVNAVAEIMNGRKQMTPEQSAAASEARIAELKQIAQIKEYVEADFKANKQDGWKDAYEIKDENIKATSKDIQTAVGKHVAQLQKDAVAQWIAGGKIPVPLDKAPSTVAVVSRKGQKSIVDQQQSVAAREVVAAWEVVDMQNQKMNAFDPVVINKINNDLGQSKNNAIASGPELLDVKKQLLEKYRSRDRASMKSKDLKKLDLVIIALENDIAMSS